MDETQAPQISPPENPLASPTRDNPLPEGELHNQFAFLRGIIYEARTKVKSVEDAEVVDGIVRRAVAFKENNKAGMMRELAGPKHQVWMEQFEQDDAGEHDGIRVWCIVAGNRAGKTRTQMLNFEHHIRHNARDGNIYYIISPTWDKSRSGTGVQWEISRLFPSWWYIDQYRTGDGYSNNVCLLRLPNNRGVVQIKFKFAEQDYITFETDRLAGVLWDEAEDEGLYEVLLPRLVDQCGFMLISTLPNYHWITRRIEKSTDKNYHHLRLTSYDNPNVSKAAIDSLAANLSEYQRRIRVMGEDAIDVGLVFPQFRLERHVVKSHALPAGWPRWVCIDPGWQTCAVLWLTVDDDERVVAYRELYLSHVTTEQLCKRIIELSQGETIAGYYLDPQGAIVGAALQPAVKLIDQFRRGGLTVTGWRRTVSVGGKEAQVDRLRVRLDNDAFIIHDCCKDLIREMQIWSYRKDANTLDAYSDRFEKGNDHCLSGDTLIWTSEGRKRIDSVDHGIVFTPYGWRRFHRLPVRQGVLYRWHLSDGSYIDATEEHKIQLSN